MRKRTYTGKVISTKMQKTIVVAVDMPKRHPLYAKAIKSTKTFMVHDDLGVKVDDMVRIEESRPFSKNTSWIVSEKISEEKTI